MQKIAELNATSEVNSSYLYEKDVYDPDKDPDNFVNKEENMPKTTADGFELPDFLKDIEDGIIKIQ
jgi:hypothetical protein